MGTTLSVPNRSINLPIAREVVAGLVPKIESAMMYSNNVVVFMDLCIMGVMFVISLSPNLFLDRPSPQLLPSFLYGGDVTVVDCCCGFIALTFAGNKSQ